MDYGPWTGLNHGLQLECADPACTDLWELAGGLLVNASGRGRPGLRLGLWIDHYRLL